MVNSLTLVFDFTVSAFLRHRSQSCKKDAASYGLSSLTTPVPVSTSFIELDAATYSDYQFIKERNYNM